MQVTDAPYFIFVVNTRLGHKVRNHIEAHYPELNAHYEIQWQLKGFGHAVLQTKNHFDRDEAALIHVDDAVFDFTSIYSENSWMSICESDDPSSKGEVETFQLADSPFYSVESIVEKPDNPQSNLVFSGACFLTQIGELFDALSMNINQGHMTKGEYQFTDAVQKLLKRGKLILAIEHPVISLGRK